MQKLLLASHNPDKIAELRDLLTGLNVQILSLSDFPQLAPTIEDQDTLEGNAMKKALEASRQTGLLCLADDTGLFIDTLDGAPGVLAARFAGEHCSYQDNRTKALSLLQDQTNRRAEFRTSAALAAPDGIIALKSGRLAGTITTIERGDNGFGYDSIFEPENLGRTFAELTDAEKNSLSHRARALQEILPIIKEMITIQK